MGKKKDVNVCKKSKIMSLLSNTNYSQREISRKIGVSRQTVQRIASKIKSGENPISTLRKNSKGKRLTTPNSERIIRNICSENRKKPRKIITTLIKDAGISISDRTVRRRLDELGFKCYRPAKKPKLTIAMKDKRLKWAIKHRNMTTDDWRKIFIS
ncbi:uncharacterized protein LOC136082939 [Hydra vulgaris]|uniref:Uncharacterized protein LOC136082939 n=1 Tax=Hydra vulgaris TaxID=6087 RepID=A0ABM4C9T0_HYDVU